MGTQMELVTSEYFPGAARPRANGPSMHRASPLNISGKECHGICTIPLMILKSDNRRQHILAMSGGRIVHVAPRGSTPAAEHHLYVEFCSGH